MKKVFAISGQARHGKDTTAAIFKSELERMGYKVLITHYGDLLKYICTKFFDWNGIKDARGRTILQKVGTERVRAAKPNFWVDFIVDILTIFDGEWDYVFIPDARFPNEVDMLTEAGFDVIHIRVERPHFDNGLTPEQLSHPSETALYSTIPDVLITNDGSVSDLKGKIDKWIEENIANGKT